MDKLKKSYRKPVVEEVNLVPEEAVLQVCKNHPGAVASDLPDCSWPKQTGGGVCRGVTGS